MMGLAKSGFLMGFGSLATPLMALALPVPQAAAIMLPLLLVMDITGMQAALARSRPRAAALAAAGRVARHRWSARCCSACCRCKTVAAVVGGLTLLFLAQRLVFPPRRDAPPPPRAVGFVLAIAGGFTSFVAHAGSPPLSAYVLPLRLPPIRLTATMAVLFAAVNLSKWIPYAWLGLLDSRNLVTSLALMPLAPLGVWLGVWATRRIAASWFYRIAYTGMFFTGVKLLWDGLR